MHRIRMFAVLVGAVAALTAIARDARAGPEYPNRPVTMIVPYSPAGGGDTAFRILAEELQKVWGQRVIVDNRPGGATVIGTNVIARAAPDGYTMGFAGGSFVINPGTRSTLPYNTLRDFRGIAVVADSSLDIVASPGLRANSLPELIALARTQDLTYATSGPGSMGHMAGELLALITGMRMVHVPYSGGGAATTDVLAGRVDFRIGVWSEDRPNVASGRLKLLSILYPERVPDAADTPTVSEVVPEMAQYPAGVFYSVVVPAAVPQEIVDQIGNYFRQAVTSDSFRRQIGALGLYPRYTTPAETDAFLHRQIEIWTDIAHRAHVSFD